MLKELTRVTDKSRQIKIRVCDYCKDHPVYRMPEKITMIAAVERVLAIEQLNLLPASMVTVAFVEVRHGDQLEFSFSIAK
jgi:hypothetical protein